MSINRSWSLTVLLPWLPFPSLQEQAGQLEQSKRQWSSMDDSSLAEVWTQCSRWRVQQSGCSAHEMNLHWNLIKSNSSEQQVRVPPVRGKHISTTQQRASVGGVLRVQGRWIAQTNPDVQGQGCSMCLGSTRRGWVAKQGVPVRYPWLHSCNCCVNPCLHTVALHILGWAPRAATIHLLWQQVNVLIVCDCNMHNALLGG
jgi:hypothetical protein